MEYNSSESRGISRIIYQALNDIAPNAVAHSQIIDHRLLQSLEDSLRQKMVYRADGSPRLVIDLMLTRTFAEIKQSLRAQQVMPLSALLSATNASPQPVARN